MSTGTSAAPSAVSPNIVGGTPAPSYSAVASLQLTYGGDPDFHWCGGTLIDAWDVQTNAHCVTNEPAQGSAQRAAANLRFSSWLATHPAPNGANSINFGDPSIWHLRIGSNDRLHGGVVRGVSTITVFRTWGWGPRTIMAGSATSRSCASTGRWLPWRRP
jgi:hypothetical protein